ncbi:hypothetical protein V8G54_002571 [Vigna mungo]|uniref:YTH domain-containing family protein n=1 Tax=Vigna mungo TaxID=3915 RepID=A0AAQ3PAL1_VIGMU
MSNFGGAGRRSMPVRMYAGGRADVRVRVCVHVRTYACARVCVHAAWLAVDTPHGRTWLAFDRRYKGRSRYFPYGNELNRGLRAKSGKNLMAFAPPLPFLVVQDQNLPETLSIETSIVPDREQYNKVNFPEEYAVAKFFDIKSYNEDNIHKSIKYNVWANTQNGNKKLDAAYQEAQQKPGGCPVFLFFLVNTTGQFVGLAKMIGPVDFNKIVEYWRQDVTCTENTEGRNKDGKVVRQKDGVMRKSMRQRKENILLKEFVHRKRRVCGINLSYCYIGAFIIAMAENTRLKELQTEIRGQAADIKKLMELLELRDLQSPHQVTGGSMSTNSNNGDTHFHKEFHVNEISLGFSHFDGHSPVLEWIFKAEKFFDYHHTPDADKVDIVAIHFKKDVVPWFHMLQRLSAIKTWIELTTALESQFGPSSFDCPMAEEKDCVTFVMKNSRSINHRCPKRQFMLLQLEDPGNEEGPDTMVSTPNFVRNYVILDSPSKVEIHRSKNLVFVDHALLYGFSVVFQNKLLWRLLKVDTGQPLIIEESQVDNHHLSLNALKAGTGWSPSDF